MGGGYRQREPVQQGSMSIFSDKDLAISMIDQPSQFASPIGRVDPDNGGASERPGPQPEEIVGHVVQEHADVRRGFGVTQLQPEGCSAPALFDKASPGPCRILKEK